MTRWTDERIEDRFHMLDESLQKIEQRILESKRQQFYLTCAILTPIVGVIAARLFGVHA